MPVETGSQILNYQGSAALGSGSNASIPAIDPKANLDVINQSARDISYMNHANNIKLFEQKIKDRNDTLDLLATGQISAGKIDPNDRKVYDAGKKKVSDNFYKMIQSGGLNNPTAVREYYDSVNDLKNIATWAQSRQLEFDKLNTELAQQDLPEDQQMYKDHIQKSKEQPFWNQVMPMQKAFDYNYDQMVSEVTGQPQTASQLGAPDTQNNQTATTQQNTITDKNGVITNKTTVTTKPVRSGLITNTKGKGITTTGTQVNKDGSLSEISYTPEKYWDLPTIQQNVRDLSTTEPRARYAYERYFTDFQKTSPQQQLETLQAKNNRLAQYSQQRGLATPEQIKFYADPATGQIIIQETPESFFAKTALASINGDYVEQPQAIFNKDIANYKNDIRRINLDERELAQKAANDRGELAVKWANYGLAKDRLKDIDKEDLGGADAVLNEAIGILQNATPQPVYNSRTKTQETLLRISDPTLLQSFGTIDKDGTTTNVPDLINYDPKTNQPTLIWLNKKDKTGKTYEREVPLDQRTWLKLITKRSFPNKDIGKINSLLEDVLQKNGNSLYDLSKKENTQPRGTYEIGGKKFTEDQLIKGAAKYKMSLEDYKKSIGL